jgi:hypothetical protein
MGDRGAQARLVGVPPPGRISAKAFPALMRQLEMTSSSLARSRSDPPTGSVSRQADRPHDATAAQQWREGSRGEVDETARSTSSVSRASVAL